jgi:hypothetical protein
VKTVLVASCCSEGCTNTLLAGNRATDLTAPDAVLVGTGANNTNLRNDKQ